MATSFVHGDMDILPCTTLCTHQGCIGGNSGTEVPTLCVCLVVAATHCPMPDSRLPIEGNRPWLPYMFFCICVFSGPVPLESNRCMLQWLGNRLPLQQRPRLHLCVLPQEQHTGRMGTGRLLGLTTRFGPHLVHTCILGLHLGHTLSTRFNDFLAKQDLIETRQSKRSPIYLK